jgi:hypothetical protein
MVMWPGIYHLSDTPASAKAHATSEESLSELAAAQDIIVQILEANNILLKEITPCTLSQCNWLADMTAKWEDPGEEEIVIPDMRKTFVYYDDVTVQA